MTNGWATAYSKREHEFTFAKNRSDLGWLGSKVIGSADIQ